MKIRPIIASGLVLASFGLVAGCSSNSTSDAPSSSQVSVEEKSAEQVITETTNMINEATSARLSMKSSDAAIEQAADSDTVSAVMEGQFDDSSLLSDEELGNGGRGQIIIVGQEYYMKFDDLALEASGASGITADTWVGPMQLSSAMSAGLASTRRTQILSAISDSSFDNVETLTSDDGKGQYRLTGDNDAELIVDAQTMLPVSVSSYDGLSFDASDWNQIAAQVAPQVG